MIEILMAESTRKMDKIAIENWGIPSIVLMENAVFSLVKYFEELNDILIVCGPGNNGGDGLALARQLYIRDKRVKVYIAVSKNSTAKDFSINFNLVRKLPIEISMLEDDNDLSNFKEFLKESKVIVDCLFGTGLKRNVEGIYSELIKEINTSTAYKISVDVPSGLCSNKGITLGDTVIADKTVTFQTLKKGFLNYNALKYLGELTIENIGIPSFIVDKVSENIRVLEKQDIIPLIPIRKKYDHKGQFGKICIVAGDEKYSGAAYLSTQAAVKTGSGLVTLYTTKELKVILSSKLSEAMVGSYYDEELKNAISKSDVIVFGPGLGDSERTLNKLKLIIDNFNGKLLIDADGINVLKDNLDLLHKCKCKVVLTPHPGEMSRLIGISTEEINENRIEIAKDFSRKYNVILLLKGFYTVISDGKNVYINPTGNSSMASGGMGDTLSGIIGSLMGQGVNELEATMTGVYLHGYIGEQLSESMYSVSASEIIEKIPLFLKEFTLKVNK